MESRFFILVLLDDRRTRIRSQDCGSVFIMQGPYPDPEVQNDTLSKENLKFSLIFVLIFLLLFSILLGRVCRLADLKETIGKLAAVLVAAPTSKLQAVYAKYSNKKFMKIARYYRLWQLGYNYLEFF